MKNKSSAAAILALAVMATTACITIDKAYAEQQGRQYAKELGISGARVVCMNVDSNGDGYVSCTLAVAPKDGGKPDMQAIECAASKGGRGLNNGCRIPKGRMATNEGQ